MQFIGDDKLGFRKWKGVQENRLYLWYHTANIGWKTFAAWKGFINVFVDNQDTFDIVNWSKFMRDWWQDWCDWKNRWFIKNAIVQKPTMKVSYTFELKLSSTADIVINLVIDLGTATTDLRSIHIDIIRNVWRINVTSVMAPYLTSAR